MRLSLAVFDGLRAGVVQKASGFDGFGRIRADSVRLRRILDHMPAKPPFPPETQTHFGPPNRWGTGPLGHRAGTGGGVEAAARGKHPTVMAERAPRGRGLRPPHAESTLTGRVPGGYPGAGLRPPPPLHLGPLCAPPPRCGVPALQHAGKC